LIGVFLASQLKGGDTKGGKSESNINLPKVLDKLTPKEGDLDYIAPDPTGVILDTSQVIIIDTELRESKKELSEMEKTLTIYRSKVDEAKGRLELYQTDQKKAGYEAVNEVIYGEGYSRRIKEIEASIERYDRIIFAYERLIQHFKQSITYYYCNGYTPALPDDKVDITYLEYNIIIVKHANGTETRITCGWNGKVTHIPLDSPYHPKQFFKALKLDFPELDLFDNISFEYYDPRQWGTFTPQFDETRWQEKPPSAWGYYLNIFNKIYVKSSVDILIDINQLWNLFFSD